MIEVINSTLIIGLLLAGFGISSTVDSGVGLHRFEQTALTRAEVLRGNYGRYRANNDLRFYHLDIRVDPAKRTLSGKNTIRFKMLRDDNRIQLDLVPNLKVEKILLGKTPLKYRRELNAVFVDFPQMLKAGRTYSVDFHYSGKPFATEGTRMSRPGFETGMTFGKDPAGRPWITTNCEGPGASTWWPNKDQWRDEPDEGMLISVTCPNSLMDVSNGRFAGKTDVGGGYTRWDWRVHYPINNYDVAVNIGKYAHFDDRLGDLTMDFYCLPENLEKAKAQFAQAKPMLQIYDRLFGEFPFIKDGYKLVETPYAGMEHQTAVAYGNGFENGYGRINRDRDLTGVGISLKFDYIIIHESGHEYFGNAVSAADISDMWIHEGWTTYLEVLYVEAMFGREDSIKYVNGYKRMVQNRQPIIAQRGLGQSSGSDMYTKGALFLNTLRSVVDDDAKWLKLLHDLFQHFKYRNIMTEELVAYVNEQLGQDLTPIFNQYLRHADIPTLELKFGSGTVEYRWKADEKAFAMPIRVGERSSWQIIQPTTEWQSMPTQLPADRFEVATDLYYVNVTKL